MSKLIDEGTIFERQQLLVARDYLIQVYLDWTNNYLTVEKFAEHHGLTPDQGTTLIALATQVYNTPHPEA